MSIKRKPILILIGRDLDLTDMLNADWCFAALSGLCWDYSSLDNYNCSSENCPGMFADKAGRMFPLLHRGLNHANGL